MPTITFSKTPIIGLVIIEPAVFEDERGFFFESYNRTTFASHGIDIEFVQDNHSRSAKGVLRGLHFQKPPHAQAKLARVISGSVFDVAVDIRVGSPTYGKWFGAELSAQNKKMMYIPIGFAHGFCTLEDDTEFLYKCSGIYMPASEGRIKVDDPTLNISGPFEKNTFIISAKDRAHQTFAKFQSPFTFA